MPAAMKKTLPPMVLSAPENTVRVLAITPFDEDHAYLTHTFPQANWRIERAGSRAEAMATLREGGHSVLLCEESLPDASWRQLLEDSETLPNPPVFVVASRLADNLLWAEVLNVGGYDVLMKPFDRYEVVRVLSQAWRQWREKSRTADACAAAR